jgi:hypothetical protein
LRDDAGHRSASLASASNYSYHLCISQVLTSSSVSFSVNFITIYFLTTTTTTTTTTTITTTTTVDLQFNYLVFILALIGGKFGPPWDFVKAPPLVTYIGHREILTERLYKDNSSRHSKTKFLKNPFRDGLSKLLAT